MTVTRPVGFRRDVLLRVRRVDTQKDVSTGWTPFWVSVRSITIFVMVALLLALPTRLFAQATDEPTSPPPESLPAGSMSAEQMERAVEEARAYMAKAQEEADKALGLAFNLLGLFEAFGLIISVGAVIGGVTFARRLQAAEKAVEEARQRFQEALEKDRQEMLAAMRSREEELAALRVQLEENFQKQRQESQRATLALSLLPSGESQYKSGDFKGALAIYQSALELDDANPVIHYRLAYVHTQLGDLKQAQEHLRRALEQNPEFPPALAALGYVFRRIGEKMDPQDNQRGIVFAEAERYLRRALQLSHRLVDDDGESWWGSLGSLLRRRGQIDDAITAYELAAEVTPLSSYPFSNLARLYARRGEKDRTRAMYAQVERLAAREVEANVDNYWGYSDLLVASLILGKEEQAGSVLESLFDAVPKDAPYVFNSIVETLQELAQALGGDDTGRIQPYVERIRAFLSRNE